MVIIAFWCVYDNFTYPFSATSYFASRAIIFSNGSTICGMHVENIMSFGQLYSCVTPTSSSIGAMTVAKDRLFYYDSAGNSIRYLMLFNITTTTQLFGSVGSVKSKSIT